MNFGICNLSIIPIRKESSDASEMVSQLLFGELFSIIKKDKQWLHIKCDFDDYEGWIDAKQAIEIDRNTFGTYQKAEKGTSMEVVSAVTNNSFHLPILIGSTLPYFDGMNFKLDKYKYMFNGQAIKHNNGNNIDTEFIKKCAQKFLHAPYLWGGRSPFGIDCSGFVQIVFKLANIPLKRDAYQQVEAGQVVDLLEQTQIGDLAFFTNDEDKITHVGIIIETEQSVKIIHASGKVRIDVLDHYGIYNKETKNYSHKLKLIKRLL